MKRSVGSFHRLGLVTLLTASLVGTAVGVASAQAAPPPFVASWPFVQGAPMNEFNNNGLPFWGMDIEPLAFGLPQSTTALQPALAQSWTLSPNGRVLTVQLRPNDRWSNGQPVTAQDVKAAWALMYIEGWVQFTNTAQVNVLGPRTVQFVRFNVPDVLWVRQVLTQGIEPPFPYEQAGLLPSNIWTTIYASMYNGTNPALKKKAAAANAAMAKLSVKISALAPKVDIADGPWYLQSVNAGEEIWQRNPYFFNNAENHINTVIMRNQVNNQVVWNWMMHGQIDYASTAMPLNVMQAALRVPGNHFVNQGINVGAGLEFNEHDYPFNLVQVRQALAYAINRVSVQKIGEPVEGTPWKYLTGMSDIQSEQWLPKSVLNSLNPYNYDPAKAASLLESVGFKKVNGNWMMPNGKPFTINIQVEAGFSDYDEAASAIENELDAFGIPTKVFEVNTAEYFNQQQDGDYAVSFQFVGGGNMVYPAAAYKAIYINNDGWTINGTNLSRLKLGNVKGSSTVAPRERDIPTVLNIPGLGAVKPAFLAFRLTADTSPAAEHAAVVKLAEITNYYLPVLPLFNQYQSIIFSTLHYTDWPPVNSYLQNMNNVAEAWMYWAQYGWIKPVQ